MNLNEYLERYGALLGEQAAAATRPLHNPSTDAVLDIPTLRKPFDPQAHCIAAGVKALKRQPSVLLCGEMGTGKAQPLDAKLLTPEGWIEMGDVLVGETLIDPDGETCKVLSVHPQGVKDIYRVRFSDGSSTKCCDEHLWTVTTPVRKWRDKPWLTMSLAEIRSKPLRHDNGNLKWFIPMATVDYPIRKLPLDPYLLGVIIGDGCITQPAVTFSSEDEEIVESVTALCPPGVVVKKKTGDNCDYAITTEEPRGKRDSNPVTAVLRSLNLMGCSSLEKFIPPEYLRADREQRIALLQGLCDTDGSPTSGCGVDFSTSSIRLAGDVQELVESLGGTVGWSVRMTTYRQGCVVRDGAPSHRMYLALPPDVQPFRLKRKAERCQRGNKYWPTRAITEIEYVGKEEAQCIRVDSQRNLYVTDRFIVTHNTIMTQLIAHGHAGGKPYRAIVMCPGHLVGKWRRELEETIPGVKTFEVSHVRDLVRLDKRAKPTGAEWFVISKDRAKLEPKWRGAFLMRPGEEIPRCPKCGSELIRRKKSKKDEVEDTPILPGELQKKRTNCPECKEPLWTFTREPWRWAPATYIHRKLKGFFRYLVIDEAHEMKGGADVAQANAAGSLAAAVEKVIACTGTLTGGKIEDIRPLLFRLSPRSVIAEGYGWGEAVSFADQYGLIETRISTSSGGGESENRMSKGRSSRSVTRIVRPGIMPALFGRHLVDKTIFLGLKEMADNLPEFTEQITPAYMDKFQADDYKMIEDALRAEVRQLIRTKGPGGAMKLLGPMLNCLMAWPDYPFDWTEVGYKDGESWNHVVTPPGYDPKIVLPKEKLLLETIRQERMQGRQVWVFVEYTEKIPVLKRLTEFLARAGLKAHAMHATVEQRKREDWIRQRGKGADVILSHPGLVKTGLDLFDKGGNHNFPTLVFYETGWSAFTMRQAARRAWRIGQQLPCKVLYLYCSRTAQEGCLELMGRKIAAAEALEGKFSSEGMAAMGSDDSVQMALAKSLAENIGSMKASRQWQKVGGVDEGTAAVNWLEEFTADDSLLSLIGG